MARERWLAREGGPQRLHQRDRCLHQVPGQIQQERDLHQVAGRPGLPGARDQLLLHPDLLREPDQEGHQQPLHPAGHDRVLQGAPLDVPHREQGRREQDHGAGPHQQALPRERREDPPEHQDQPAAEDRHGQPRAEVHRLPFQGQDPPRGLHRGGRLGCGRHPHLARRRVPGRHAGPRQDPELPEGGLPAHLQVRDHHGPAARARLRRRGQGQAHEGPLISMDPAYVWAPIVSYLFFFFLGLGILLLIIQIENRRRRCKWNERLRDKRRSDNRRSK